MWGQQSKSFIKWVEGVKKRRFFRSCIALLMSTVLLGNEMGIVSIAEETALLGEFQEEQTESGYMGETVSSLPDETDANTASANGIREEYGISASDPETPVLNTDEIAVDEDGILFDTIEIPCLFLM